jgi:hypothetical protein
MEVLRCSDIRNPKIPSLFSIREDRKENKG